MRLMSFQVKNCFGFVDSSQIELAEPDNLIYVLGRNSAGKTALLTALAHLSPQNDLEKAPNLINYNRRGETPRLIAHYSIDPGDFSIDTYMKAHSARIARMNPSAPDILRNPEYAKLLTGIEAVVRPVYENVMQQIEQARETWVERVGSGAYGISPDEKFADLPARLARLSEDQEQVWRSVASSNIPVHHLLIAGNGRQVNLPTAEDYEELLFEQFPRIVWFGDAYMLRDVLPKNITHENVGTQCPVLQAFISLLGPDTVRRFLSAENPDELDRLRRLMQERLDSLIAEVNKAARSHRVPDLLEITLYPKDGLQINVKANGKFSYYQHISDNTKFLFAYFLYLRTHKIENSILLLDEPSNGFHATAQEELLRFLRALRREKNLVIVSTHSEHLIDPDHLTGVRLMKVDDDGYLSVRNRWYASTAGHGDFQALRPILDAIGLKYGSNHLTIRDKVIVSEGVTELLYVRALRQLLGISEDIHIAPATGDESIPHVVSLLISQGLKFKVIVDTPVGKNGVDQRLRSRGLMPDTSIYVVPPPSAFPATHGSGIEDVFSKADFAKLLSATGNTPRPEFATVTNNEYMSKHPPVPKRVVAHVFLEQIGTYTPNDFEPETLQNARQILEFCINDNWCQV